MTTADRRSGEEKDRRRVARGGRRPGDRPGRYPTLLVADSYDGARVPCARYLDHFGFQVEQAVDGPGVLGVLAASRPDVILVEYRLPMLSARTLVDRLAAEDSTKSIPVVVMVSDFDVARAQPLPGPAAALLVKPFPLTTMIEEVRRALRSSPPGPSTAPSLFGL